MSDENILRMERIFEAPRERVFEAWTRPELVARWWGCWSAGKAPVMEVDARPGGSWRFAMAVEDGTAWMGGRYTEVVPHSRLAFSFSWEGQENPETPVLIELEDLGDGRTKLILAHDLTLCTNACEEGWDAQLQPLARWIAQAA